MREHPDLEDHSILDVYNAYPAAFQELKDLEISINMWGQDGIDQFLACHSFWKSHFGSHHHPSHIKRLVIIVTFLGGASFAGLIKSSDGHSYNHVCHNVEYHLRTLHEAIDHIELHHHRHEVAALPHVYVDFASLEDL